MPLTSAAGRTVNRMDWPEIRMCKRGQVVVRVEGAGQSCTA